MKGTGILDRFLYLCFLSNQEQKVLSACDDWRIEFFFILFSSLKATQLLQSAVSSESSEL